MVTKTADNFVTHGVICHPCAEESKENYEKHLSGNSFSGVSE